MKIKILLRIVFCVLALLPLAIINFFYSGILGCVESIQDTNQEIRITLIAGKTLEKKDKNFGKNA